MDRKILGSIIGLSAVLGLGLGMSLSGAAFAAPPGSTTTTGTNTMLESYPSHSTTAPSASSASSPADSMRSGSTASSQEFARLDIDGDGIITKKEAGKSVDVKKQWGKLDTNKDGKLDAMEFAQFEVMPAK